jgi:hypothetical protein
MEKIRHRKTPRSKLERIGILTGLLDVNGDEIRTGDTIHIKSRNYTGIVLWHRDYQCFGLFMGMWYGDNPYDADSYGKFITIPADNGMRMELETVRKENDL